MNAMAVRWITLASMALATFVAPPGCDKKEADKTAASAPAGKDASVKAKPIIGVSLLTLTNPFFKEIGDTLQAEGAKHGYEVIVTSGDQDPSKQKNQVKDFLVRKASAIVLTPCDSKSIGTAIAEANAAGVPVFTADIASLSDTAKVVCHTATDNYDGGRVAGKAMVEALKGKGKVAIIDHPEVESGLLREKGFEEEIAKSPDIQVVAKLAGGGARDRSFAVAQDLMQSHPDLTGIFAINDPSALGAIAAFEKAGKLSGISIVGFDGQPEARQAIKDGKLYGTVIQSPHDIAASTIDSIAHYMAGDDVKPTHLIATTLYRAAEAKADATLK